MTPKKVTFYVYSESDSDIAVLEKALHDFVRNNYDKGLLITASKVTKALNAIVGNPIIQRFIK